MACVNQCEFMCYLKGEFQKFYELQVLVLLRVSNRLKF